jgi:hypothetical protein
MILIKNEKKEIKRLKEKGLFNSATFKYIYKPIKAREWSGYKNTPNK